MPWKPHPCAFPGCTAMLPSKSSIHCRKHHVKTPEHVAKIAASNRGKRLSQETRALLSNARRGEGTTERICAFCGKPFTVEKPSSKVRLCSRGCGYANRRGERAPNWLTDMPITTCRICGKTFRHVTRVGAEQRITCSYRCKGIWLKARQPNKHTNIERSMAKALTARRWDFTPQHPLCNVTVADFYLPATRTVIFCDGDYWHSLPGKPERDRIQTAVLEAAGYTVYRFLGSAILHDVEACLATVEHRSSCGI